MVDNDGTLVGVISITELLQSHLEGIEDGIVGICIAILRSTNEGCQFFHATSLLII